MNEHETIHFSSREECRDIAIQMVKLAKHYVRILSVNLEPFVLDNDEFVKEISRFVLHSSKARVQILTQQSRQVMQHGHRLIETGRKFTSNVEFRRPGKTHAGIEDFYLLIDETAWLHKFSSEARSGKAQLYNPLETRNHNSFFSEIWENAAPDEELRRIYV